MFLSGLSFTQHASASQTTNAVQTTAIDTNDTGLITMQVDETIQHSLTKNDLLSLLVLKRNVESHANNRSEITSLEHCPDNFSLYCDFLFPLRDRSHVELTHHISVHDALLREILTSIANSAHEEPLSTTLSVTNDRVTDFTFKKYGRQLNITAILPDLSSQLQVIAQEGSLHQENITINLPTEILFPSSEPPTAQQYGIYDLLGEGISNFAGSSRDRIFNIKRALQQFEGQLIPPGEELSFVDILGEVEKETGYRAELVIRNNKTEPEYGGGICQVSTTLFRSAIYSGLKITDRRNHSYPVKYYTPTGFDATIFVPRPDLKFLNNTQGHLLITSEIQGTDLVFRIYGTSDGRRTEVDLPIAIAKKHPDEYMRTSFSQRVYTDTGSLLYEDVFISSYDNPENYPHPEDIIKEKPKDWSKKEWEAYKKDNT